MSALAAQVADRIAERMVGIRQPRVLSTQVQTGPDGRVRVLVNTDQGTATFVEERPVTGGCYDCGRPYGDEHGFPDLVVPHEVWNEHLSPVGHEGGLLCPSCMCARAHTAGLSGVPARFTSGPFAGGDANA